MIAEGEEEKLSEGKSGFEIVRKNVKVAGRGWP